MKNVEVNFYFAADGNETRQNVSLNVNHEFPHRAFSFLSASSNPETVRIRKDP